MRIGIIPGVLGMLCTTLSVHAQKPDSVRNVALPEVVIAETYQQLQNKKTALTLEVADRDFLRKHFTGNFMQAMENIPGVHTLPSFHSSGRAFPECKQWISVRDSPS